MRRNHGIIGPHQKSTNLIAGGIHDTYDLYVRNKGGRWPMVKKYLSISESTTSLTENSSMTITVTLAGFVDGQTIFYSIETMAGTTMVDADFDGIDADGGEVAVSSNQVVFTFECPGDDLSENNQFRMHIREGSVGGTIMLTSQTITVTDAAAPAGEDIRSGFYDMCNRGIVDSTSSDYTGAYDVSEVQQAYTGTVRIYIIGKVTTSTTYINDICIAGVQWLNSGNTVQDTWNFSNASGGYSDWGTTTSRISGTSAKLNTYLDPSDAAAYTYSTINTTYDSGGDKFFAYSTTGSSYTGAADGIATNTTSYPVGNGQISQVSGTNFIYNETSGATRYYHTAIRSPEISINAGDKIRIAHLCTIRSTMVSSFDEDDSIWVGVY